MIEGNTDFNKGQNELNMQNVQVVTGDDTNNSFEPRITKEDIRKAFKKLEEFKNGKNSVDERVIANEKWFRQRHWQFMKNKEDNDDKKPNDVVEPTSAWMFNSLFNKHADAMDNYPTCNFLPREESDREAAKELSSIIPVILKLNGHRKNYSRSWWYLLKFGTLIEATLWDKNKYYGMGDVSISRIDILNFFPEPDVLDIQQSSDVFYVYLVEKEKLLYEYPDIEKSNLNSSFQLNRYAYDDSDPGVEKIAVIDWYYKKQTGNGTVLHFCKFVGDAILYASENDPEVAHRGIYDHGEYPFDVTTLFPVETSLFSFGFIDIMRSPQAYIDRLDQTILTSAAKISRPKTLIDKSLGINMKDLADLDKEFVEFSGTLSAQTYQQITPGNLSGIIINHYLNKIQELKETSGNRDVNQGSAGSLTSGTAIAALQESGSKGSRDILQDYYTSFESQCKKIASLVTQFYTQPRKFRITNEQGQEEFIKFSNKKLVMQDQMRLPEFDVEIVAQKQNRYTSNANNEMALSLYNAGFFNPQNADQALACVELMSFDNKEQVITKISQNGLMYQQMMQMQEQLMMLSKIVATATGDSRILQTLGLQSNSNEQINTSGKNVKKTEGIIGNLAGNTQADKARIAAQQRANVG